MVDVGVAELGYEFGARRTETFCKSCGVIPLFSNADDELVLRSASLGSPIEAIAS